MQFGFRKTGQRVTFTDYVELDPVLLIKDNLFGSKKPWEIEVVDEPTPGPPEQYWWRVDDVTNHWADCDKTYVQFTRIKLLKETKKGWWVQNPVAPNLPKWVSKTSRKRYAYPTKEEALESWKIRKRWRVLHLKKQLREALAIEYASQYLQAPKDDDRTDQDRQLLKETKIGKGLQVQDPEMPDVSK